MTPKQKKEAAFYIVLIILASISLFFKSKFTDQPINALIQSITQSSEDSGEKADAQPQYTFRNRELLQEHYKKHGQEMGIDSADSYEQAASAVVTNPKALHKLEAEDGDDVYYVEASNELVIVSKSGYIRTYFNPDDGKAYFNRQ